MQIIGQSEADREQNLWIASRSYVKGEIDISRLEEIESDYTQDFNHAMITISKENISHSLFKKIRNLCKVDS